jgi:H+/Cl- antiporter ClcA
MILCSLAVGVVAGFGAVAFRAMIGGFHNLLFLGQWSFAYDANVHTLPSPWGAGIILVPVVGAIGVAFLVQNFAPEAKGHGVPEVMEAVYYHDGRIRPVVALVKSLASALSIDCHSVNADEQRDEPERPENILDHGCTPSRHAPAAYALGPEMSWLSCAVR